MSALRTDVSALYIDPRGPYPKLLADCWDEARDARNYAGPNPVVAHPPCSRWCALAHVNQKRYGQRIGDDGGCFASALASVRRWGGVLEHPAFSIAWRRFDLQPPTRGCWQRCIDGTFVCELSQAAYGFPARKLTWLYAVGVPVTSADWSEPAPTGACGRPTRPGLKRIRDRHASRSPIAFAEWLISLAAQAKRTEAA